MVRPNAPEPDVVVLALAEDRRLAEQVAASLSAAGFFVVPAVGAGPGDAGVRSAIEAAADVVVVLSAAAVRALRGQEGGLRDAVAYAFDRRRVVVPLCLPDAGLAQCGDLPADVARLVSVPVLAFDPGRVPESLARLAHSLSSDAEVEDRRLMRRARAAAYLVAAIAVGVVAFFLVPPVFRALTAPPPKAPLPPFTIAWAGIAERAGAGTVQTLPVTDGVALQAGDRLRLVFATGGAGYVYVLVRTPETVSVVFPTAAIRGASRVEPGVVHAVPGKDGGIEIPAGGQGSAVFLIGSYDPLENLEELAEDSDSAAHARERLDLLDSTVAGLLDGRHAAGARAARTRAGHAIGPSLPVTGLPATAEVPGTGGVRTPVVLVPRSGAVSAAVELRVGSR